ncbi:class I SAM-dependent methyltransferase [Bacillus alkalicellulosilyticus]|uniref:class I SAM-dependent methyltransferase n=1 Tax=Alkalihalobacterium alkalicellulosilyticum TaxID=1912214 RepID=UPI0009978B26|nr:class I SAM-dependent methyltransferase [Bacillus alkalicellulosilyticus]
MNSFDYEKFYEEVGKTNGWDFSNVKSSSEDVGWNFYEEVIKLSKKRDTLLDIGTGGGENLLKIASSLFLLIGIDLSIGMIETARANVKDEEASNVKFFQMSSDDLQFPTGFFDIVSCCHAPFSSKEIARVLKDGGYFLTQQVSEADKRNIKDAFGRGQAYDSPDGTLKERYKKELYDAGFTDIQYFDYDAVEYFERPEDLIFLLSHTPIIPNFGQDKSDFERVNQFIEDNRTEKGIRTNSKRFMMIANK